MSDTTTAAPTIKDQDTRDRIGPWRPNGPAPLDTFERDTNFVVRAAAGSGKTTALVGRMLALVRTGTPVEHIAAITFTKKAAGEMQARFYEELMQAQSQTEPESEEAKRIQAALDQLPNCFIGTIHSFCQELLRTQPEAAGVAKGFTTLDEDRDKEELRDRFWQRYLEESWTQRRDQLEALIDIGVEVGELASFFGALADQPEMELYTDDVSEPALDKSVDAAHAFLDEWLSRIPDPMHEDGPDRVMKALIKADNMRRHLALDARSEKAALLAELGKMMSRGKEDQAKVTQQRWPDSVDSKGLKHNDAPQFVMEHVRPVMNQWRSFAHARIVDFVAPAVKSYQQHRWANGQLTFSDLLVAARNLLRDNPDVRERFHTTYQHVLVDEFQDTDPLQAEVLFYLTGKNTHERDWRRCDPRPGSLFIVGDDKQSIYGFRQADMAIFDEVAGLIDDQDCGDTADLVTNFRSAERICDWCDDAFGHLFENDHAQAPDSQAEYVGFEAQRKVPTGWSPVQQLTIPKVKGNYPGPIARHNADQIAQYIHTAIARDESLLTGDEGEALIAGTPGDFMILTRNTKRLSIYAEALAERGIPYTVAGGKDAGVSEELQGLADLLACVLRADDPVARVAYLRGPLVGLSDDALYRLKKAYASAEPSRNAFSDASLAVPGPVASRLDADLADRLQAAYALLTEARHWLATERPAVAVQQIAEQAGLFARALHQAGEASLRAGRLYRLLDEVRHLDGQGLHWSEILEELEDILHGERELDGMTLETGQRDSVRLLNVHKAKGLQANVVFLADPYAPRSSPSPTSHMHRKASSTILVQPVLGYYSNLKYGPAAWEDTFKPKAEQERYAEEHRLQYVAATRPKRLLVVSRYAGKEDKGFWADLYPFLDAIDAPELTPPSDTPVTPSEEPPVSWQPDLSAASSRRAQAIAAGSHPRYREEGVTDAIGVKAPSDENGGRGKDFGTAVHDLFEMVNDTRDSALATLDVIGRVLQHHTGAAPADRVRRVRQMIEAWTTSNLWGLLCASNEVHTEIPIATFSNGEEAVLQRGVIDLVFRGPDGWVIVDFKTNRVGGDDHLQQYLSRYGPQLQAYVTAWAGHTGSRVRAAGLWFTDTGGTWAPIDPARTPLPASNRD